MFNITESPYWIVVDYCKRNIHVCWIFGPSLLSHGNGWFCFVGKKTFLLMRKKHKWGWNELKLDPCNQYRGKKQWFITTNDADLLYKHTLSPDGDHPLGTAGYCHHVGLKYISAWRFFFVTSGKVGKHWRRGYSWWQWTLDPCCNMDDYSAIPNCRHLLWGTIYKFFKYTMEESTINL